MGVGHYVGTGPATPKIVTGTYTGDGLAVQTINLGFEPIAVIVESPTGYRNYTSGIYGTQGGMALRGYPLDEGVAKMKIVSSGFTVSGNANGTLNGKGRNFYYIAFK